MSDFTRPKIRLHTVNIREQFVAPLMDGRLKAITRLNGRGYNTGDYLRFSVLPMQSSDVQFSMTTDGERDAYADLFDTAYPEGYDSQYTKRHAEPSLDSIAKVATEAASDAERPLSC